MTPGVSVLIVSRGRTAFLADLLRNVTETYDTVGNVEVLVWSDDDDPKTADVATAAGARVVSGPRGGGYRDMHRFWNALCAEARGRWLFMLADDCVIDTKGWDTAILAASNAALCALHPAGEGPSYNMPIFTRRIYEVLGHCTLCPAVDTWIEVVCRNAGIIRELPSVSVRHLQHEPRFADTTHSEAIALRPTTHAQFISLEMCRARDRDTVTLLEHLRTGGAA